jgi:protein-histidine pros-kinase
MTALSRSQADAILATIVEGTDDAIVGRDPDGTIITWNTGAAHLYGYTADEACGQPVTMLVPSDRREELRALEERTAGGERIGHFETVRVANGGRRIDVSLTLAPMWDAAGTLIGQSSIARDMTKWTRAERKFVGLLESAPDAIVIVDTRGTIVIVNSQTERLFGYARDELVGRPVETLIPRRYRNEHEADRVRYATAPRPRPMGASRDLYAVHKDGREIPVDVNLSPFDTDEGPLVISSVRDVTERRRFEQTLREQNVALENASLAKDRFLASMSHELRTPLNAVIGFTGTLLMEMPGPLNPEQDRQLRIVGSSAKHLLSLINDLLDLAKIQSGKFDLRLEPVACQPIINEVVAALRPTAEIKGLRLIVDMPKPEVVVAADRRALSQILLNLTINAIKFTATGEVCAIDCFVRSSVSTTASKRSERGPASGSISVRSSRVC